MATEAPVDGGIVSLSVNGGAYAAVRQGDFRVNRYNATIQSSGFGNTNPLGGQVGFTGTDGGSVGGSWGQSQIDLDRVAQPGDTVRLRWEFGVDGCNGVDGWYVDNVVVCAEATAGGRVPDKGTLLRVERAPNDRIDVSWGASCLASDIDYALYEGSIGDFTGHTPRSCSTGGSTSLNLLPAAGGTYYLAVPINGEREGSYGFDGSGGERAASGSACLAQSIDPACD